MIGTINEISTKFEDYNYIINGVAGIGKTQLAHDIGYCVVGSDKGTLILTMGAEPIPKHIRGAFYEPVPTFNHFAQVVKELVTNKKDYAEIKFICIDSLDELFRVAEDYVVKEYNVTSEKKVKSISGAYGGFQKGENRVIDLVTKQINNLNNNGYRLIEIGHTKTKSKTDALTGLVYEQLTCNLDNKYYSAVKDKVNLVATCYTEKVIDDIKEVTNAFTKKLEKKGKLVSEKRVIIFRENDSAVDTKTHFAHIVNKIDDFSAEAFIKTVTDALEKEKNGDKVEIKPYFRPVAENETETVDDGTEEFDDIEIDEDVVTEIDDDVEIPKEEIPIAKAETTEKTKETEITKAELIKDIKVKFKSEDTPDTVKAKIRKMLKDNNTTLTENIDIELLKEMAAL